MRSAAAPIVVMPATGADQVADAVAPGQRTLGLMLPYTSLHHLLLAQIDQPIVLTSGNLSEEPQCIGNEEARRKLAGIADYGLFHNRDIVNRIDEFGDPGGRRGSPRAAAGARLCAGADSLAEGFAACSPVLAMGGELKNTFCLLRDGQAILSQHIGDLEDAATFAEYQRSLALYRELFDHRRRSSQSTAIRNISPPTSARNGRPATAWRWSRFSTTMRTLRAAWPSTACRLVPLPSSASPLTGWATATTARFWGGEFLIADYLGFTRVGYFKPVAMPGGAQAVRQPWRNTFAHLDAAIGWERCASDHAQLDIIRFLAARPVAALQAMIRNPINSPPASSCGRLFDAVAAASASAASG